MNSDKFIEYLVTCGKIGYFEKKYIGELRKIDINLKEAWQILEKLDKEGAVSIYIISILLSIQEIYRNSSYEGKVSLYEFFKKYVHNFSSREKYIRSSRGIIYAMQMKTSFDSTRYFNDFEELRILKDNSFSNIKMYIKNTKVIFRNDGVDRGIKVGDGREFGEAVFIKDDSYEIVDIDSIEEYTDIMSRALDNESYDIMILPYIVQSKGNDIIRICIDGMELDNVRLARILRMVTLLDNEVIKLLREIKIDITGFVGSMLCNGIDLSNIGDMIKYMGNKDDISETMGFLMIHTNEVKKNGIDYLIDKYEI